MLHSRRRDNEDLLVSDRNVCTDMYIGSMIYIILLFTLAPGGMHYFTVSHCTPAGAKQVMK